jgi:hypothetical protein
MARQRKNPNGAYWIMMGEAERQIIVGAYKRTGSVNSTAKLLGLSGHYLMIRIAKLGEKCGLPESVIESARLREEHRRQKTKSVFGKFLSQTEEARMAARDAPRQAEATDEPKGAAAE